MESRWRTASGIFYLILNMRIEDQVILVDKYDNETGVTGKMRAHKEGLLHRAFSVFLFNDEGDLLLQQRAYHKYHSGGLWTNTCCSHPRPGEEIHEAAHRRLKEEMGITGVELLDAFNFIYFAELNDELKEHEFDYVLIGKFNGRPNPDKEEVNDWHWISPATLLTDVEVNPKAYTFWFKEVIERVLAHCQSIFP
jgi:isopentenyl-diphosphate Delta-isomerase